MNFWIKRLDLDKGQQVHEVPGGSFESEKNLGNLFYKLEGGQGADWEYGH